MRCKDIDDNIRSNSVGSDSCRSGSSSSSSSSSSR
jgi:hypothetical protein